MMTHSIVYVPKAERNSINGATHAMNSVCVCVYVCFIALADMVTGF